MYTHTKCIIRFIGFRMEVCHRSSSLVYSTKVQRPVSGQCLFPESGPKDVNKTYHATLNSIQCIINFIALI